MAQHDVTFDVPARPLGRADVNFKIKIDKKLIGTLSVSNGSVVWFPSGKWSGHKVGWTKFDELMQKHASRFEKRSKPGKNREGNGALEHP